MILTATSPRTDLSGAVVVDRDAQRFKAGIGQRFAVNRDTVQVVGRVKDQTGSSIGEGVGRWVVVVVNFTARKRDLPGDLLA